jgi:hypothetical protein
VIDIDPGRKITDLVGLGKPHRHILPAEAAPQPLFVERENASTRPDQDARDRQGHETRCE